MSNEWVVLAPVQTECFTLQCILVSSELDQIYLQRKSLCCVFFNTCGSLKMDPFHIFCKFPSKPHLNEITSLLFLIILILLINRQTGQDTVEEVRSRDFRKDLEENERQAARERVKEKGIKSAVEQPKRPRLDQPPPSNLDADDPIDDDDDDDDDERCYVFTCH